MNTAPGARSRGRDRRQRMAPDELGDRPATAMPAPPAHAEPGGRHMDIEDADGLALQIIGRGHEQAGQAPSSDQRDARPRTARASAAGRFPGSGADWQAHASRPFRTVRTGWPVALTMSLPESQSSGRRNVNSSYSMCEFIRMFLERAAFSTGLASFGWPRPGVRFIGVSGENENVRKGVRANWQMAPDGDQGRCMLRRDFIAETHPTETFDRSLTIEGHS